MTRRRFPVGKTLLYVFMSLWALPKTIYPFIWVILNSFKPRGLIRSRYILAARRRQIHTGELRHRLQAR